MKGFAKIIIALAALLALGAGARAQDGDNDGCSLASLHGDYSFTIHGESIGILVSTGMQTPPRVAAFASPLLADGVAITHFDGDGYLKQVDFVMRNGTSAATPTTPTTENGFRSKEWGSYKVSEDCTGTFKIMFPDTSEIDAEFVLANHGLEIRTVVTRQHVPGLPAAIIPAGVECVPLTPAEGNGCDLAVQISSDGVKIGSVWRPES